MCWDMRPNEEPLREFNAWQRGHAITLKRDTCRRVGPKHRMVSVTTLSPTSTKQTLSGYRLHGYIQILLKTLS